MPLTWRYFCCICNNSDDDKRAYSARYSKTRRRPEKRHSKSGKNTWTRRSLIENEQTEHLEIPIDQMPYQMRAIPTPTYEYDRKKDRCLTDNYTQNERRNDGNDFDNSFSDSSYSHVSKTTFPWMDERFVPNERSGMRLGVSSVQLHAKRREPILKQSSNRSAFQNNSPRHAFVPYKPLSVSFSESEPVPQKPRSYVPQVINPNYIPSNFRNVQSGRIIHNDISADSNLATHVKTPVQKSTSNDFSKPLVLKAPTSDVGVRRISSNSSHPHQQKHIPRLEEYIGHAAVPAHPPPHPWKEVTINNSRPSVMDIFPPADDTECDKNFSFSGDVIFRKHPSDCTQSEVSLKRTDSPDMFYPKISKYERLKSQSTKTKEKPKTKAEKSRSESMYGYVPKVVQNVHASTALEGTQIDDFFRQNFKEDQSYNFGTWKNQANDSEEEPYIITTIVGSEENLAADNDIQSQFMAAKGNYESIEAKIDEMVHVPHKSVNIVKDNHVENHEESVKGTNHDSDNIIKQTTFNSIQQKQTSHVSRTDKASTDNDNRKHDRIPNIKPGIHVIGDIKTNGVMVSENCSTDVAPLRTDATTGNKDTESCKHVLASKSEHIMKQNANQTKTKQITDENENKVIMIDFPPNSDNDKKLDINPFKILPHNGDKTSSEVGTSATKGSIGDRHNEEVLY